MDALKGNLHVFQTVCGVSNASHQSPADLVVSQGVNLEPAAIVTVAAWLTK